MSDAQNTIQVPQISHALACKLSRTFNQNADLRRDDDVSINEWLKRLISIAYKNS